MTRVTLTDLAKREADVLKKHCTERSHPRKWHNQAATLLMAAQAVIDAARKLQAQEYKDNEDDESMVYAWAAVDEALAAHDQQEKGNV